MSLVRRVAVIAASAAVVAGGTLCAAAPASASPAAIWTCNAPQYLTGSGGHAGVSLQCFGTSFNDSFNTAITCKRLDNGYEYRHDGPIVVTGHTSTVWCDLNARIIHVAYVAR
ncbi:hypothetical protein [Streptomyces sp. NPDC056160]|uniref:hypothetical protein n=1 Tax=Streptomyces sp. NPDC056160 TaxID=3345731 RepID=UPI0035E30796